MDIPVGIVSWHYVSFREKQVHEEVNRWIIEELKSVETCGHCINMHKYTHDSENQIVDHILRLENIDVELPNLLKQYGLDGITLGTEKMKASKATDRINVSNLTLEAICRINEWAKADFEYFGYDIIENACADWVREISKDAAQ